MNEWAVLEIINNNEKERDDFRQRHDSCGSTEFVITKEQLFRLLEGKCIAMSDGEYCNFLSLKEGDS